MSRQMHLLQADALSCAEQSCIKYIQADALSFAEPSPAAQTGGRIAETSRAEPFKFQPEYYLTIGLYR